MKSRGVIGFAYYDKPFSHKNEMWSYHVDGQTLNIKYVYHFLKLNELYFQNIGGKMQMPQIAIPDTDKFEIPIPCPDNPKKSFKIQAEIARILDAFTELNTELNIQLNTELAAREKQYNHYCDQLLNFEEGKVGWRALGEVCSVGVGQAPPANKAGEYAFINAGTTPSGHVATYNTEPDTITTPSRGQGGIGFVGYQADRFWCGPLCYRIRSSSEMLSTRFLFHVMASSMKEIVGLANMTGVPALNKKELIGFQVPIPSLVEQKRIVAILDKFDALTHSISEALPREIALRQKKYEYYRDLLFRFPKPKEMAEVR